MSADWNEAFVPGAGGGRLPEGYRRRGAIVGPEEVLDADDAGLWTDGRFVARAETPHTTSAVEARIRRRHLERLLRAGAVDPARPALELGCGDGLVTHALLELGFERLVSSDIAPASLATLERSLEPSLRDRVLLVADDMLRLPFPAASFATVIAWGVLSVSGDLPRALELAWGWVEPGGHLLLAEPVLESVLVYTLVRGDLDEFRRTLAEGTRAAMWDRREDRYPVNPHRFYEERIAELDRSEVVERGGISMLPSLIHGGVLQETDADDAARAELSELLAAPERDELTLWRQAYWLVRKR